MERPNVRIPPITGVAEAIHIFWEYPELSNKELERLFGKRSPNTYSKLKKAAWEKMQEMGAFTTSPTRVPTHCAYLAWGLDINDLEKRYARLQKLKPREEKRA